MSEQRTAAEPNAAATNPPSARKRALVAGGVAAAVALVAAMSYVVLTGGSENDPVDAAGSVAPPPAATQPVIPPTATTAPEIAKFTGKNAKDPFKALVVAPVKAAGSGTAASTEAAPPVNTGAAGSAWATNTAPALPNEDNGVLPSVRPTATPTLSGPVTITMVTVNAADTLATIKLDKKTYKDVKPLSTFGTYFKLLTLSQGKCGSVQYGDVTFDLCEGDTLTVR